MALTTQQLIDQSKAMVAQTQAEGTKQFAGSSYDTTPKTVASAPSSSGVISAATLGSNATPVTPVITPTQPIVTPAPVQPQTETKTDAYAPTDLENQISSLISNIGDLRSQGKTREQLQYENDLAQGVAEKKALVNASNARLQALQNEASGIDLAYQNRKQEIQQQAQTGGANVTKGGLAPTYSAEQTYYTKNKLENAAKQYSELAINQLAQGNLTAAIEASNKATEYKYADQEKKINDLLSNLDLISKDPRYTPQQQKRADEMAKQKQKELDALNVQKENDKTIQGLALQAAQNGAPDAIINAIKNAKDPFDAISAGSGWVGKETATSIQEYNFAVKNGYTGSFSQYQNEDANRKMAIAKAGVSNANTFGLTPNQVFTATQSLKKSVTTNTEAARELQRQSSILSSTWNRYKSGEAKDLNGTSQAIITTFNKLLDPTSVVREAEYDRSASGQALISTIQGKLAAVVQGGPGLTEQSLKELVDLGNLYAQNAQKSIDSANARAKEEAAYFGLNSDFVGAPASYAQPSVTGTSGTSAFSDIQSKLTLDQSNPNIVYIDRATWNSLGTKKDALLAEIAADGGKLLVK